MTVNCDKDYEWLKGHVNTKDWSLLWRKTLKVTKACLYKTRCLTGSQCSLMSAGVIWINNSCTFFAMLKWLSCTLYCNIKLLNVPTTKQCRIHLRCLYLGGCSNANFSVAVTAFILVLDVSLAYVLYSLITNPATVIDLLTL